MLTLSQPAQGGVSLVARQIEPLEWQSTIASNRDCDHQVRCISPGLGAVCDGTRTGGPWSHAEQEMHINRLELLAATLAVKAFLKDQRGVSVKLQLENQTAVAYINNMGETVSPQLTKMWALSKDIVLTAQSIFRGSRIVW